MDTVTAGSLGFVIVNIIWTVLHSNWKELLQIELSVSQGTLNGRSCTAGGQSYCGLNGVF